MSTNFLKIGLFACLCCFTAAGAHAQSDAPARSPEEIRAAFGRMGAARHHRAKGVQIRQSWRFYEAKPHTRNIRLQRVAPVEEPKVLKVDPSQVASVIIPFVIDRADLRPEASAQLDEICKILSEDPKCRIIVTGHTDSQTGTVEHNNVLSVSRAATVRDYLTNKGYEKQIISAGGVGSSYPIKGRETDAEANRRVSFVTGDEQSVKKE